MRSNGPLPPSKVYTNDIRYAQRSRDGLYTLFLYQFTLQVTLDTLLLEVTYSHYGCF